MRYIAPIALSLCLLAPIPAFADGHVAATVMIDGILEYASVGQSVFVTQGEDGAPEAIEVGMTFLLVDADDENRTFTGTVSGPVVNDDGTPNGSWTVLLTE